jgi:hypothetical protein
VLPNPPAPPEHPSAATALAATPLAAATWYHQQHVLLDFLTAARNPITVAVASAVAVAAAAAAAAAAAVAAAAPSL